MSTCGALKWFFCWEKDDQGNTSDEVHVEWVCGLVSGHPNGFHEGTRLDGTLRLDNTQPSGPIPASATLCRHTRAARPQA